MTSDFGYLSCQRDVMLEVQSACSGRHSCKIRVDDTVFSRVRPCHRDLKSYLTVSYTCTAVVSPSSGCSSAAAGQAFVDVGSSSSGLLSSHVTEVSGCGAADWPWLIDVGDGQTVNVTLYDFSHDALVTAAHPGDSLTHHGASHHGDRHHGGSSLSDGGRTCKVYATIRDGSGSRSTTICGGRAPVTHVFLSTSSRVEIRVLQPAAAKVKSKVDSMSPDVMAYFLLRYQVVGCVNPTMQPGMRITRNHDVITISCDVIGPAASYDDSVWQMTCVGNRWIGSYGNCSGGAEALPSLFRSFGLRHSMSISLIAVIALCVVASILIIGAVYIKWPLTGDHTRRHPTSSLSNQDVVADYDYRIPGLAEKVHGGVRYPLQSTAVTLPLDGPSELAGNDYATMRLLQLSSPACAGPTCPVRHCFATDDTGVEHIYESPDSVRRTTAAPPRPGEDWTSGNFVRNQAAMDVGGRYELPVNSHDQQTFTAAALTSAVANYSL